jgi:hypothetical protein
MDNKKNGLQPRHCLPGIAWRKRRHCVLGIA